MLENRRLSYFAWTTDYSVFVRAQDDAVETTVERAAQDGRVPDFVEPWRATVRHRGRDYDDPEFVRLECDVLQWAALAPSDEAPEE
jgi:hypothetical protein